MEDLEALFLGDIDGGNQAGDDHAMGGDADVAALETAFFDCEEQQRMDEAEHLFLDCIDLGEASSDQARLEAELLDIEDISDVVAGAQAHTASSSSLPVGIERHSPAWSQHLNRCKQQQPTPKDIQHTGLANGWNQITRRHGDLAFDANSQSTLWVHGNTYTMSSTVKAGFQEVGKGTHHLQGSVSIDSDRRGLSNMTSVSALTHRLHGNRAKELYKQLSEESTVNTGLVFFSGISIAHLHTISWARWRLTFYRTRGI